MRKHLKRLKPLEEVGLVHKTNICLLASLNGGESINVIERFKFALYTV